MSTRDWSEAYFASESSVHGRAALGGAEAPVRDPVAEADRAYRAALRRRHAAVEAHLPRPLHRLSSAAVEAQYEADDSGRAYPRWVLTEERRVEAANVALWEQATEAWLESDESEALVSELCAARAAYDAALAARQAERQARADADAALASAQGWIVAAGRGAAADAASRSGLPRWDGRPQSVRPRMVLTVSEALWITSPRNADRYIPEDVTVYQPEEVDDIGLASDVRTILGRL